VTVCEVTFKPDTLQILPCLGYGTEQLLQLLKILLLGLHSTDSQMSMQNDWMQQTRTRSDHDNTHTQDHNRVSNSTRASESCPVIHGCESRFRWKRIIATDTCGIRQTLLDECFCENYSRNT